MLELLTIKNFAIIENTEIEFRDKMTVLTGETGAGKTIIIDAISLLLGERAYKDMIRYGETKALIEGVFSYENPLINKELYKLDIDIDDKLIIRRIVTKNSSTIKVNGQTVNLSSLKKITKYLIDIHLQNDSVRFLQEQKYQDVLDRFGNCSEIKDKYLQKLNNYRACLKDYNKIKAKSQNMNKEIEFMKFSLEELDNLNLSLDEEKDLKEKAEKLNNFDKIYNLVKEADELIDNANIDSLYDITNLLEKNQYISDELKASSKVIKSCYYDLLDAKSNIKNEVLKLEFDPKMLDEINARLNDYERIKRKKNMTTEELLNYQESLREEINNFEDIDGLILEKYALLNEAYQNLMSVALKLSNKRKDAATKLKEELEMHLKDLSLTSEFLVKFTEIKTDPLKDNFTIDGIDEIDFLISTNKGEPLKPLAKTASGGELSRFMLALKTILLRYEGLSTIIFDEIDTGVSGKVAYAMAKKLKLISNSTQVLLITHLPQVASIADYHIFVSKEYVNGRTISKTTYLNYDERIKEIAKMLSKDKITKESLIQAKQLLDYEKNSLL